LLGRYNSLIIRYLGLFALSNVYLRALLLFDYMLIGMSIARIFDVSI